MPDDRRDGLPHSFAVLGPFNLGLGPRRQNTGQDAGLDLASSALEARQEIARRRALVALSRQGLIRWRDADQWRYRQRTRQTEWQVAAPGNSVDSPRRHFQVA
jgi:hypothetical protein